MATLTSQDNTLAPQLKRLREDFMATVPDEIKAVLATANEKLAQSDPAKKARKVDDQAPAFSLPNVTGQIVSLAEVLTRGPVVLSFYRGGWCPYCNLELQILQQHLPEIQEMGASLLAISPQTPDHSLSTAEKHQLQFDVLSDQGDQVAHAYGLVFTVPPELHPIYRQWGIDLPAWNGDESWKLPLSATYVIDRQGLIRSAFVNLDYTQRMEPADILSVLREMR